MHQTRGDGRARDASGTARGFPPHSRARARGARARRDRRPAAPGRAARARRRGRGHGRGETRAVARWRARRRCGQARCAPRCGGAAAPTAPARGVLAWVVWSRLRIWLVEQNSNRVVDAGAMRISIGQRIGLLPSPLWGGVGGGGRCCWTHLTQQPRPPPRSLRSRPSPQGGG